MPFVNLGLVPAAASPLLLPRLIGRQRAAKHLLLGDSFDAETALEYGLVTGIVPAEELGRQLCALSERLAAKPPEAVRLTKALLIAPDCSVRSEEHTSELQSLMRISYAVFCLKKKKTHTHI